VHPSFGFYITVAEDTTTLILVNAFSHLASHLNLSTFLRSFKIGLIFLLTLAKNVGVRSVVPPAVGLLSDIEDLSWLISLCTYPDPVIGENKTQKFSPPTSKTHLDRFHRILYRLSLRKSLVGLLNACR